MPVFRINKTNNYTVMSNHHLRNENLSLKAKGLLSIMLSLPSDWDYSIAGLCSITKEGKVAIKSALTELKKERYLVVTKLMPNQTKSGKIEYIYDIFELPNQDICSQGIGNLPVESQYIENNMQLNKDYKVRNNKIKINKVVVGKGKNSNTNTKHIYELSKEELEKLKQVVLENRDTRNITYKEIQKQFELIESVSYNTPDVCDMLIERIRCEEDLEQRKLNSSPFGKEVF